jgi:hypothetical protein
MLVKIHGIMFKDLDKVISELDVLPLDEISIKSKLTSNNNHLPFIQRRKSELHLGIYRYSC